MPMPPGWGRPPRSVARGGNPIVTLPDERMYERHGQRPNTDGVMPIDMVGLDRKTSPDDGDDAAPLDPSEDIGDESDGVILARARRQFLTTVEAEAAMRSEMVEDQRFYGGDQWPAGTKAERNLDKRPILTINRLPQFVKQITNPQRQSRPAIQVNPVSDGADVETAEIIQGIIRHIENTSHADVAYDEAYKDAVVTGRGWFRILTDYVHDGTFEQDIFIRRIPNPLSVYPDPAAIELDYSDGRYLFIVEDIPMDEYRDLYGEAAVASLEMFTGAGNKTPEWFPEGYVRIAEYFYVENVKRELALIRGDNGEPLTVPLKHVPPGVKVERKRTVMDRKIHWVKMSAAEVLEHKVWPGRWIPVVPVLGDEVHIDGRKTYTGIVRFARDPQRMYNYWVSAETETIALAPRAPFIGAAGQFKNHPEWKTANTRNHPYMEYEPISADGKPVGAPQRQQYEPPIRAIVEATKQADNDLKAVTGFYDASLGQPGPDQSGRAILARQKQGETANVNFIDNLGRSLWHAARIYLDLIPKVYDAPRVIHIIGMDDQKKRVVINDPANELGESVRKAFDVRTGRYNVTMSVGPSYISKRQEAVQSMLELIKANPALVNVIGDLLVGEMDWPMARQIAARLKKILPPQLQDMGEDGQPPTVEQLETIVTQLKTMMQQKDEMLQQALEVIKTKKIETLSAEAQTELQERTKLTLGLIKVDAEQAQMRLRADLDSINQRVAADNDRVLAELADLRSLHATMATAEQAHGHASAAMAQQAGHEQDAAQAAAAAAAAQGGGGGAEAGA